MKLSPQKELIVNTLRDLQWHCGREWIESIKDDRIRITELNRGYMKDKGYEIVGEPCKGSVCGIQKCPLYKRRAQKTSENYIQWAKQAVDQFDKGVYLQA